MENGFDKGGRKGHGRKGRERAKGSGTLEKRGSVYFARWTVDGKRYSRSTGVTDRREAEKKLEEFTAPFRIKDEIERTEVWQGKLDGGRDRLRKLEDARPALPLSEAWNRYLMSPERPDTACARRLGYCATRFGYFVSFMREKYPEVTEMRRVTKEHAQAFAMSDIFAKKSGGTRNEIIMLIRAVWRVLADDTEARLIENPWEKIRRIRKVSPRRRELTVEELTRVCSSLTGEMRILFALGIYTGLRLGDCATLKWESVDLVRRIIRVVPRKTANKTGACVTVAIHPALMQMLLELPAPRIGQVLPEIAADYESGGAQLSQRIKSVFENAGIETQVEAPDGGQRRVLVGFHSLRHTFVSLAANAGVPLAVVQSIVGHASVDMTRHYFHESEAAVRSAVAALPDVLEVGCEEKPSASDGAHPRLEAVYAAIDGLSDEELDLVSGYVERRIIDRGALNAGGAGDV